MEFCVVSGSKRVNHLGADDDVRELKAATTPCDHKSEQVQLQTTSATFQVMHGKSHGAEKATATHITR